MSEIPERDKMSAPSSSSSSFWLASHTKLVFFTRIRRFLQSKTAQKINNKVKTKVMVENEEERKINDGEGEISVNDSSVLLQRSVKKLNFGNWEEKEIAAVEIGRLAKGDSKTRKLMGELGVIPVLVGMVESEYSRRRQVAVKALIELANGTHT